MSKLTGPDGYGYILNLGRQFASAAHLIDSYERLIRDAEECNITWNRMSDWRYHTPYTGLTLTEMIADRVEIKHGSATMLLRKAICIDILERAGKRPDRVEAYKKWMVRHIKDNCSTETTEQQSNPEEEENEMSLNVTITTTIKINGQNLEDISSDRLFELIIKQSEYIDSLFELEQKFSGTPHMQRKLKGAKETLQELVDLLDSREK